MNNCSNLFFLSTISCKLAECLSTDELTILSTDLMVLGDMIASIVARETACENIQKASNDADSCVTSSD